MSGQTIDSSDLLDRLKSILGRLAYGRKSDPSWARSMPLTISDRKRDYDDASAIIDELHKRSNAQS